MYLLINFSQLFCSPYDRYYKGSRNFGYDQFAQYYVSFLNTDPYPADTIVTASGSFYQAAYSSITAYNYSYTPDLIIGQPLVHASASGWSVTGIHPDPNPYIVGNPSVLAYQPPDQRRPNSALTFEVDEDEVEAKWLRGIEELLTLQSPLTAAVQALAPAAARSVNESSGKVAFYRLDEYLSSLCLPDSTDFGVGGCSDEYIFAPTTPESSAGQVYIVRVRVPTTFFNSSHPSTVYDSYQSSYFSVSSNRNNSLLEANHDTGKLDIDAFLPKYWTVDSRMLGNYADAQGYAYVFCVPDEYARALSEAQNDGYSWENRTVPPVLTWGAYTGYALGAASYAIILRYKEPQYSWEGSPSNARCYATTEENVPISDNALGTYTPQAYQGSFEDFLEGHIGPVRKNSAWPKFV